MNRDQVYENVLNDCLLYVFGQFCRAETIDPLKVKGKIVACVREGKIKSVVEGQEALSAGAKGVILINQPQIELFLHVYLNFRLT